jgi:hypothetical protein
VIKRHVKHILRVINGERLIRERYKKRFGKRLPLFAKTCSTFTEKLFSRMIKENRKLYSKYTCYVDKVLVREFVSKTIGEQYLPDIYGCYEDSEKIPYASLPQKYVLKTNHASGQVIIVKGKLDVAEATTKLSRWLESNHYYLAREAQYLNVIPRVFVEEYLDTGENEGPLDYRFWCFHGNVEIIQVDNHEHSINPFFDEGWNSLDIKTRDVYEESNIPKPENLNEMLTVAKQLSAKFDFVRVDLFNIRGRLIFGELTFTPVSGEFKFSPNNWDNLLGRCWKVVS